MEATGARPLPIKKLVQENVGPRGTQRGLDETEGGRKSQACRAGPTSSPHPLPCPWQMTMTPTPMRTCSSASQRERNQVRMHCWGLEPPLQGSPAPDLVSREEAP